MRRLKDWPAQATAPGDLPLLLEFVNTRNFETATETWTSPEALARWLEQQRLYAPWGSDSGVEVIRHHLYTSCIENVEAPGNAIQRLRDPHRCMGFRPKDEEGPEANATSFLRRP